MQNSIEFSILKTYLKNNKLRYTNERERILKAILKLDDHFGAEELFIEIKKSNRNIVLATVYNTLELLTECGLLNRYRFGRDHYRYEKTSKKPQHYHLICLTCGKITEYISNELSILQTQISQSKKFYIKQSSLQIYGVCNKCQKVKSDDPKKIHTTFKV